LRRYAALDLWQDSDAALARTCDQRLFIITSSARLWSPAWPLAISGQAWRVSYCVGLSMPDATSLASLALYLDLDFNLTFELVGKAQFASSCM
jgi:hypothetical protein